MLEQPYEDVRVELGAASDPVGGVDQQLVVAGTDPDRMLRKGRIELGVGDIDPRAYECEPVPDLSLIHI